METIKDAKSGLQLTIPTSDLYYRSLAKIMITHGTTYLPDYNLYKWCEQYLSSDNIFIDIGSGIGLCSLLLAPKCKEVHAFEPIETAVTCLAVASTLNNYHNIRYHKTALSSHSKDLKLFKSFKSFKSDNNTEVPQTNSINKFVNVATTASLVAQVLDIGDEQAETVKSATLDSFNLQNIGFISIDVDRAELDVIMGSVLTLLHNNFPPIMIKIRGDEWYKEEKELVLSQLRNCGYVIHPIGGCVNRYLASDHNQHKSVQQIRALKQQQEQEQQISHIVEQYTKQHTEQFTWYEWYIMARHYRMKSEHQLSYNCAQRALTFVMPEDKKYLVWEELSIVTCYLNKRDEGYDAAENVITSEYAPFNTVNLAMKNQSYYMNKLPLTNVISITHSVPPNYVTSSAAIIAKKDGYFLNVRAVNYEITTKGNYFCKDDDKIIRTRNYLLNLDNDLKTIDAVELLDNTGARKYAGRVHGIEDLRLFAPGEFFSTCLEVNNNNVPQMCYGQFGEDGTVTKLLPLQVGDKIQCEKNWLPFYIEGVLHMIYTVAPLRLYKVDVNTGVLTLIKEIDLVPDKNIDFFRGSASLIEYRDGWLGTIHQVHHDSRRMYFHRFIWFNSKFTELKYSRAFFFESPNIEFNLSICHSPNGLLMPYSVNDGCTKIGALPYEILNSLI